MSLLATATEAATSPVAEQVLFWVFATIAVGAGIAVVTMRNIVHAALMLVLNFLCIAGLYLGLQSSFLSIVQIIVYAGAIVVLFLFVIMLLGVDRDDLLVTTSRTRTVAAVVAGVVLAGALVAVVGTNAMTDASACGALAGEPTAGAVECVGLDEVAESEGGSVEFLASRLFTRWTVPFEASALLLVVATLGALVLGRRRDPALEEDDEAFVDDDSAEAFATLAAEAYDEVVAEAGDEDADDVDATAAAAETTTDAADDDVSEDD